jgi:parvulin-like peptidyl-prolyl isomerase
MRFGLLSHCILISASLCGLAPANEAPKVLVLDNEVVCWVNTEAISKKDVEELMMGIPEKVRRMRESYEQSNQLDKEREKDLDMQYIEPFRDALRKLVRQRLMLQHAVTEKIAIDEKEFDKRYQQTLTFLRKQGVIGSRGFTPAEVHKKIREEMTIDYFTYKFSNIFERPNRPDVQKYYNENPNKFQRKAGVKVRLIRVDRFTTNKLSSPPKQVVRENSFELAQELRKDIVNFGANFVEMAKRHSDDAESKERGGLLVLDAKGDPYFDPESYSKQVADALRGLKVGEVSNVFEFGQSAWAFVLLEDRREGGLIPLEGEQYDEIYATLLKEKRYKKEDEWFRKALAKSLVTYVEDGKQKVLTADFFFPDEKSIKAEPASTAPKK